MSFTFGTCLRPLRGQCRAGADDSVRPARVVIGTGFGPTGFSGVDGTLVLPHLHSFLIVAENGYELSVDYRACAAGFDLRSYLLEKRLWLG